ncbi:MAG: tyrosine-type recombinase/integrase [Methylacidiphilales bacterium]|nr:tyrosine-type recombinase/integrase [Candidatus Methylacidiphilales bacterium]
MLNIESYTRYLLLTKGLAKNTVASYLSDLKVYHQWHNSKFAKSEVVYSTDRISSYLKQYSISSQHRKRTTFVSFISWKSKQYPDIASKEVSIQIAKKNSQTLPITLSVNEVRSMFNLIEKVKSNYSGQELIILELLYGCGLRVSEVISLRISQIKLQEGIIRVVGKGGKERAVPLSDIAQKIITNYLSENLSKNSSVSDYLFPAKKNGTLLSRQYVWSLIHSLGKQIHLEKKCSPHSLRHAFATHMLNNGADIRSLQLLLGHASIATTQKYLHVAKNKLVDFHSKHHPRG